MTEYAWRVLSREPHAAMQPKAHALRADGTTALCGAHPTKDATWLDEPHLVETCRKCERLIHVRRLVTDV